MSVLPQLRLFTVEEYEWMMAAKIFGNDDRVELIDGEIIEMTPIIPPHKGPARRLDQLLTYRLGHGALVSVSAPLNLLPGSMPQPDLAVLEPRDDLYDAASPLASDVFLVVEVSDISLDYDRDRKLPLYARHSIREAWVIDIPHEQIIVARRPGPDGYANVFTVGRGRTVSAEAFPEIVFEVREILD